MVMNSYRSLCFIALVLGWLCSTRQAHLSAQSLDKFVLMSKREHTTLYFVKPKYQYEMEGKARKLSYDFTYLDNADSVALLISVYSPQALEGKSLSIKQPGKADLSLNVEYIARTPQSQRWHNRMRVWLSYKEWEGLYSEREPYRIVVAQPNGSNLSFATKAKQWETLCKQYQSLFTYIRLNRPVGRVD